MGYVQSAVSYIEIRIHIGYIVAWLHFRIHLTMERVRMLQHADGMYWATGLAKVKAPVPANLEDESDNEDGDDDAGGEAADDEAAPEAAPEVLWPAAGDKVAVGVEHLLHTLRVGETGVCEGLAPDGPEEVLVRLDSAAVLTSVRTLRFVLVPAGAKMRAFRFWDR